MLLVSTVACSFDDSSTDAYDAAPVTTPIVVDSSPPSTGLGEQWNKIQR